jgi:hypothetical protein
MQYNKPDFLENFALVFTLFYVIMLLSGVLHYYI